MQKYALVNAEGYVIAFYSDEINASIPMEAVAITHEQWADMLDNPGCRRLIAGAVVECPLYEPATPRVPRYPWSR